MRDLQQICNIKNTIMKHEITMFENNNLKTNPLFVKYTLTL